MLTARLVNAATLVIALGTGPIAKADIATEWNAIAIEATAVPPNSILQSRVLAITHAAMYDAARLINQKAALFAAGIQPDAPNSLEAAVATAAHNVLRRLAPAQSAAVDAAYKSALSSVAEGPPKTNGVKLGQMVAEKLLELRATDGSTQKTDIKLKDEPGSYQLTLPHSMHPILAHWGAVAPFVIGLTIATKLRDRPAWTARNSKPTSMR